MSDAGEGLVDADARIQERLEELERERNERLPERVSNPDAVRELESLRLARTELERQRAATTDERRRAVIVDALAEIDRRAAAVQAQLT
jgi:hypothetical protein